MREWPLVWAGGEVKMMYRLCPHEAIHPDPDSWDFRWMMSLVGRMGIAPDWHPCCDERCCQKPVPKGK